MGNRQGKGLVVNKKEWKIGKLIGTGAYGEVHELQREHKIIAVKIMNKCYLENTKRDQVGGLYREFKILSTIQLHPNIIPLYATINKKEAIFVLSELAEKGSLYNYTSQGVPLGEELAHAVTHDIIRALYFIHKQGIVHRDVKPENILIKKDNTFALADFNCSMQINEDELLSGFSGSFEYVSPQMITNEPYRMETDMWSLGVVIYEILSGRSPWRSRIRGLTRDEIKHFIDSTDVRLLESCNLHRFPTSKLYHIAHLDLPRIECSSTAASLLSRILERNRSVRFTSYQCLNHTWVKHNPPHTLNLPYIEPSDKPHDIPIDTELSDPNFLSQIPNWINPQFKDIF